MLHVEAHLSVPVVVGRALGAGGRGGDRLAGPEALRGRGLGNRRGGGRGRRGRRGGLSAEAAGVVVEAAAEGGRRRGVEPVVVVLEVVVEVAGGRVEPVARWLRWRRGRGVVDPEVVPWRPEVAVLSDGGEVVLSGRGRGRVVPEAVLSPRPKEVPQVAEEAAGVLLGHGRGREHGHRRQ